MTSKTLNIYLLTGEHMDLQLLVVDTVALLDIQVQPRKEEIDCYQM